jgi:hypothetical protein
MGRSDMGRPWSVCFGRSRAPTLQPRSSGDRLAAHPVGARSGAAATDPAYPGACRFAQTRAAASVDSDKRASRPTLTRTSTPSSTSTERQAIRARRRIRRRFRLESRSSTRLENPATSSTERTLAAPLPSQTSAPAANPRTRVPSTSARTWMREKHHPTDRVSPGAACRSSAFRAAACAGAGAGCFRP